MAAREADRKAAIDAYNRSAKAIAAVAKSLEAWHEMIARRDLGELEAIVHPEAVFRSPMAINAYRPRPPLLLALNTVLSIFKDFTYYRQFASADGLSVVLEFSATVNDKQLKGIDMIRFGADGKIVEFEVMVRPASGVQALGEAMGARLTGRV